MFLQYVDVIHMHLDGLYTIKSYMLKYTCVEVAGSHTTATTILEICFCWACGCAGQQYMCAGVASLKQPDYDTRKTVMRVRGHHVAQYVHLCHCDPNKLFI